LSYLKKYDTLLFDLDGTLTDPKIGITRSVQYSLASFGINEPCLDNLVKFIGPPLRDSFMEYYDFDSTRADEAICKYREYFSVKGLYENTVYPEIPGLLDDLMKQGKTLAVATSKPTVFSESILEHFGLAKYFSLVVGSNFDGSRTKKGEVIKYLFERAHLDEFDKIIMIGDRKHDILGAKEAGIDSIGVLYGYSEPGEIESAGPTYIAHSVDELRKILL
jgi:phosphoglycolate phosphatase